MKITISSLACIALAVALTTTIQVSAQQTSPIVEEGSGFSIDPNNPRRRLPPVDRTPQQAQQQGSQTTTANRPVSNTEQGSQRGNTHRGAQFGQSFSLSRLMGVGIQGNDGKTLGSISDVIFDSTGQIRYLAASRHLGAESGQRVMLPRQAFDLSQPLQINASGAGFSISANLNQQQFEQAPSFMEQQLTASSGPTPLFSQVDQYFGINESTTQGGMNGMNQMNAMTRNGLPQNMRGQQMNTNGQQNLSGQSSSASKNRNSSIGRSQQNKSNQFADSNNLQNPDRQVPMNRNSKQSGNTRGQVGAQGNIGARNSQNANMANPGLQNQINNATSRGSASSPTNGVNVPGASAPGSKVGNVPTDGRPIDVGGGTVAFPANSGGAGSGGNLPAGGSAGAGGNAGGSK